MNRSSHLLACFVDFKKAFESFNYIGNYSLHC